MLNHVKRNIINMFPKCEVCESRGRNYKKIFNRRFCSETCFIHYTLNTPLEELIKQEKGAKIKR